MIYRYTQLGSKRCLLSLKTDCCKVKSLYFYNHFNVKNKSHTMKWCLWVEERNWLASFNIYVLDAQAKLSIAKLWQALMSPDTYEQGLRRMID